MVSSRNDRILCRLSLVVSVALSQAVLAAEPVAMAPLPETAPATTAPATTPPATTGPSETPPLAPATPRACIPDLSGEWSGYWVSHDTGHTGPIRARFERTDACHYRVVFCGRFCKVLPFRYATTLNITGYGPGYVCLGGSQRLGPLFGTFSYNASATSTRFVSNYQADDDSGKFVMSRCCD